METLESVTWSKSAQDDVKTILSRYPIKDAAALPLMWLAQQEFGNLTPAVLKLVAETCEVSPAKVWGLHSFYTLYRREDDGKHVVHVCSTLPCMLRGSEVLFDHLSEKLGIGEGETTPCGRITLRKSECLAGCDKAPVCLVDLAYHENVTNELANILVKSLLQDKQGKTKKTQKNGGGDGK